MTREECIKVLQALWRYKDCEYSEHEIRESLDVAIKALSAEPCDKCVYSTKDGCCQYDDITETIPPFEPYNDAISRKAVMNRFERWQSYMATMLFGFEEELSSLPSVTTIRPKGHWIKEKTIHGWDGHSYQCSVCGRSIHLDTAVEDLADYPYCHCGAKMKEAEREVKE